jgi:hypothetical protein
MYASKEQFAGQRASVGRDVVVGTEHGPRWGKIMAIDEQRGVCLFVPPLGAIAKVEGGTFGYEFVATNTEAEINALGLLSWTWPVRV